MPTIEERVSALESKVARLLGSRRGAGAGPCWERVVGAFENDPLFDKVMKDVAEHRRSQPNAADDPDALEV